MIPAYGNVCRGILTEMSTSHAVAEFLPSSHGLHFANRFPPGPTIRVGLLDPRRFGFGDASAGLCGGMCLFVRRRFEAGQAVPPLTEPPANGSDLFRSVVREQLRSLRVGLVPFRFWRMAAAAAPERDRRTRDEEWPRIRASLDDGRLTPIGLVRVTGRNPLRLVGNHQVLAYGYELDGDAIRLRIYDPNHPNRDDVTVPIAPAGPQSTGEALFGVVALD